MWILQSCVSIVVKIQILFQLISGCNDALFCLGDNVLKLFYHSTVLNTLFLTIDNRFCVQSINKKILFF